MRQSHRFPLHGTAPKQLFQNGPVSGVTFTGTQNSYGTYSVNGDKLKCSVTIAEYDGGSGWAKIVLSTSVPRRNYRKLKYNVTFSREDGDESDAYIKINGASKSISTGEHTVDISGADTISIELYATARIDYQQGGTTVVHANIDVDHIWLTRY